MDDVLCNFTNVGIKIDFDFFFVNQKLETGGV